MPYSRQIGKYMKSIRFCVQCTLTKWYCRVHIRVIVSIGIRKLVHIHELLIEIWIHHASTYRLCIVLLLLRTHKLLQVVCVFHTSRKSLLRTVRFRRISNRSLPLWEFIGWSSRLSLCFSPNGISNFIHLVLIYVILCFVLWY